jgi:hypothetical protein
MVTLGESAGVCARKHPTSNKTQIHDEIARAEFS